MSDTPITDFRSKFGGHVNKKNPVVDSDTCRQLEFHLRELVAALDRAYISSWQSTAEWQKQLDGRTANCKY